MTIDIRTGLSETDRRRLDAMLAALEAKLQNIGGALRNTGEKLMEVTQDRFASQTAPDGSAWKRLAPLTVAVRGSAGPVLTQSGRLKNSLNYNVTGATLRLGLNTIYAATHQFGATIRPTSARALCVPSGGGGFLRLKSVTIPARPMIGIGPKDEDAIKKAFDEWLEVDE